MRAPLDIEMWAGAIGGASIDVCYEVFSPIGVEPRVLYTRAATTVVMVSAETNNPTRVPAELRDAWKPYIEAPVEFGKRRYASVPLTAHEPLRKRTLRRLFSRSTRQTRPSFVRSCRGTGLGDAVAGADGALLGNAREQHAVAAVDAPE